MAASGELWLETAAGLLSPKSQVIFFVPQVSPTVSVSRIQVLHTDVIYIHTSIHVGTRITVRGKVANSQIPFHFQPFSTISAAKSIRIRPAVH